MAHFVEAIKLQKKLIGFLLIMGEVRRRDILQFAVKVNDGCLEVIERFSKNPKFKFSSGFFLMTSDNLLLDVYVFTLNVYLTLVIS